MSFFSKFTLKTVMIILAVLHIHAQESTIPNGVNTSDFNYPQLMNLTANLPISQPVVSTTTASTAQTESSSGQPESPKPTETTSSASPLEPSESTPQTESNSTGTSTASASQSDTVYPTLSSMMGQDLLNSTYPTYSGYDDAHSLNGSRFSCYGRSFGQYADVSKDCHIFHLCYPFVNFTTGELIYQRISFLCDANSVFDQQKFVCVDNSTLSFGCSDSPSLYESSNLGYLHKLLFDITNGKAQSTGGNAEDKSPSVSQSTQSSQVWPWNVFNLN
jgi:hypothetical protein